MDSDDGKGTVLTRNPLSKLMTICSKIDKQNAYSNLCSYPNMEHIKAHKKTRLFHAGLFVVQVSSA
jgi:hypothetical protein